jgi:Amt family ammonium transporter
MVVIEGVDLDALNYTVKVPYNGTIPTGGDSLTDNLNIWYEVSQPTILDSPRCMFHPI